MIFTFYSYKGGVGRTMALANIAELWYSKGGNVLIIDWDLESPGLDAFFPEVSQQAREHPGLLDMLVAYKEFVRKTPPPNESNALPFESVEKYLIPVYPSSPQSKEGSLHFLSAGKRDGKHFVHYANQVKGFDWIDFYKNWAGEEYFEWFRREIEKLAPIILIDSRSGVNEMSGVCTLQLADVVVAFTSSNEQSIKGTQTIVEHLAADRIHRLRPNRSKLTPLVVPARVEQQTELVELNKLESKFRRTFDHLLPEQWDPKARSLWDLRIPYVPLYAFEELVAVREERLKGERVAPQMVEAYERLWGAMVDSASPPGEEPWRWREQVSDVLIVEDSTEWQRVLQELTISRTGGTCQIAETREEAIKLIEKQEFRLIILNLNLSEGLGYEGVDVLSFLQGTGRTNIPVIIATGSTGMSMGSIYRRFPNVKDIFFKGTRGDQLERKGLADLIARQLSSRMEMT
jgi:MinD-like ATPase involved in chromosome partitioning or flagellar assembly/CheY-like chemotaxis protein